MNQYLIFILGLIIITIGAEVMLKGATKLASLLGIKPIIIGLTVVSIGTSLPELAVGITAVNDGAADIAIGNIAGTNLVNILLILGLSAAMRPLPLNLKAIKLEMYVMIFAAFLLLILCLDGVLSFFDGLLMLICGLVYMILIVRKSRQESEDIQNEYVREFAISNQNKKNKISTWILNIVYLIAGIVATIWGAEYLVSGASSIAKDFGLSDAVIGLTIVAIGTSAPELVTTIISTLKNDRDVAIGNLLGSSIINILLILGTTSLFATNGLLVQKDILWFDLPLAALVALACYPVFRSDKMVSRKEGIAFMLCYFIYLSIILIFRT